MQKELQDTLQSLRQKKPLILSLTNSVTVNLVANCLLAVGAAPVMSEEEGDIEELLAISEVLYLNIGTLDLPFIERAKKAAALARNLRKPVVLDPVGAGATAIRTKTAKELLPFCSIVRGNASEILALHQDGGSSLTLGVEAQHQVSTAQRAGQELASRHNLTLVISGPEDLVLSPEQSLSLNYGDPLMPLITGMGCALTAVIAAFQAACPDSFTAAKLATLYFGLCGQLAARQIQGPGLFQPVFIDQLYKGDLSLC